MNRTLDCYECALSGNTAPRVLMLTLWIKFQDPLLLFLAGGRRQGISDSTREHIPTLMMQRPTSLNQLNIMSLAYSLLSD